MYSKVIKGFAWQQESFKINPYPEKDDEEEEETDDEDVDDDESDDYDEAEDEESSVDSESVKNMLAEIAAKEQRAIDNLKEAQVKAEIITQEAQAEADNIKNAAKEQAELLKTTAESEIAALKQAAEAEAEKLRSDAKAECDKLREETKKSAHAEGFKSGREEGLKKGQDEGLKKAEMIMAARMAESVQNAEHVVQTAKEAAQEYLVKAEEDFAEIVLHAVGKVIPQEFIDVPQVILPAVKNALLKVRDQKEIKVRVAPASYDFVLMARDEFRGLLTGGNANLDVVADESLVPGDCVIETESGGVDARLSTQIKTLEEAVRGVLSKHTNVTADTAG